MNWRRFKVGLLFLLAIITIVPTILYIRALDFEKSHSKRVSDLSSLSEASIDGDYRLQVGDFEFLARVAGLGNMGENVILLHGFPETSIMWSPLLKLGAERGYRMLSYDQRGYSPGARPRGKENYEAQLISDDVIRIADAMEMDSFHIVGHDWGSMIAWTTAMNHPDRVISLTSMAIPHPAVFTDGLLNDPEQQKRSSYMDKLRMPFLPEFLFLITKDKVFDQVSDIWTAEQIAEYRALFSEPGALTAALNWYRALDLDKDTVNSDLMKKVKAPTLFIWGQDDPVVSHHLIPRQEAYIDSTTSYTELRLDAGHSLIQESERELIEAIMNHISSD